jgi:hypothetical protein
VQVAVACYAVSVALGLLIEVVGFFSRAVDPRVRMMRLERAMERTRKQIELGTGPRRKVRWRRTGRDEPPATPATPPPGDEPRDPDPETRH